MIRAGVVMWGLSGLALIVILLFGPSADAAPAPVESATVAVTRTATSAVASQIAISESASQPAPMARSFWSQLRPEFSLVSTLRYQADDGNHTTLQANGGAWDPVAEDFGDMVTTVGGAVRYRAFSLAARLDLVGYAHKPTAADPTFPSIENKLLDRYKDQLQLEYIAASYSGRYLELTLGDFYATLGRGMVLAIRKVSDVGIDNKLRGADLQLNYKMLSARAFAGWLNIRNFEAGTGYYFEEANDLIAGGQLGLQYKKYAKLSLHGAVIEPADDAASEDQVRSVGLAVELPRPLRWLSVYAEGAYLERDSSTLGGTEEGKGVYASANLFFQPLTLLIEGKAYDNMFDVTPRGMASATNPGPTGPRWGLNTLMAPPTAERAQAQLETNRTVVGGRVRADYALTPRVVPYVSLGAYRDSIHRTNIGAAFGGLRWRGEPVELSAETGYREEQLQDGGALFRSDLHGLLDLRWTFMPRYQAELYADGMYSRLAEDDWVEGRVALSLSSEAGFSVTGAWELYTRQPEIFDENYFSLSGQWEFKKGSTLRAMVGGERAGLKCAGGVCRFFPGFEGARLELNLKI